jgi:hypothetical protein
LLTIKKFCLGSIQEGVPTTDTSLLGGGPVNVVTGNSDPSVIETVTRALKDIPKIILYVRFHADSRHGELRRETDSWGHGTFEDCRASYFSWVNNCTENLELPSDEITPALKFPTGSCVRCKVVKETTLVLPTEDCIQGPPKELGAK